ncbi:uncharacterized protein JCM15063_003124 [Sporobolomyces koalae]|uniref:uncharacterized protein n=1 Tax=Sporobolomyces koalae TaxID=500713 RepID=UPI003174A46E
MPPRGRKPTVDTGATGTRVSRWYTEPIGPRSELVQLSSSTLPDLEHDLRDDRDRGDFVNQAQVALERVERELDKLARDDQLQHIARNDRCQVDDLKQDVSKWYENQFYRQELKKAFEHRLFGEALRAQPTRANRRAAQEADLDPFELEDEAEDPEEPSRNKTVRTGKKVGPEDEDGQVILDKEIKTLIDGTLDLPLALLKPWDSQYYLRKTKLADMNCLTQIRPSKPSTRADASNREDPLSRVIITISFHPISKVAGKHSTTPQAQTLVCLGSNTLQEIRDNLNVGGDGIPVEVESDDENDRQDNEGNEDDDSNNDEDVAEEQVDGRYGIGEMDEMGTIEHATRKRITGTFGDRNHRTREGSDDERTEQRGARRSRWKEERRVAGACFGIEGLFYPDLNGEGKLDYAKMLLEAIDKIDWSKKAGGKKTKSQQDEIGDRDSDDDNDDDDDDDERDVSDAPSPVDPHSNDISVHSTPAPPEFDNIDPTLRDGYISPELLGLDAPADRLPEAEEQREQPVKQDDPNKPQYAQGTPMHETKLGDIPFRIGQPYLFVHQGNYEHVWSIDAVRYRHVADPSLASNLSNDPYPLTTYLSRPVSQKCHICDRDPAVLYILDDFAASETPSYACQRCFDALHPEIPTEREVERAKRREDRKEQKRKAFLRESRKAKRRRAREDPTVGSGDEDEHDEIDVEQFLQTSESEDDQEGEPPEKRKRMFMDGIEVVPTVIER